MPATPAYVIQHNPFRISSYITQVCVDVKDCALCHVLAAEQDIEVINGKRYLTVGAPFTQSNAAKVIAELFPDIASRLPPAAAYQEHYTYSSAL
jgi:hypothetical protein